MMGLMKTLAAGVTVATSLAAVSPASATVISKYLLGGTGVHGDTFSETVNIGTIPAEFLKEAAAGCGHVANGCTYDFIFQLTGLDPGDTTSLQLAAQAQNSAHSAEDISFDVFSGLPGAAPLLPSSPRFEGASIVSTAPVLPLMLGDGAYFVQVTGAQVASSGEESSGSIQVAAVPEPMAWTLMLLGVGGVGVAMRRRRPVATSAA